MKLNPLRKNEKTNDKFITDLIEHVLIGRFAYGITQAPDSREMPMIKVKRSQKYSCVYTIRLEWANTACVGPHNNMSIKIQFAHDVFASTIDIMSIKDSAGLVADSDHAATSEWLELSGYSTLGQFIDHVHMFADAAHQHLDGSIVEENESR